MKNAFKTPKNAGIKLQNALIVFLSGKGGINHVVNDYGDQVKGSFSIKFKCSYGGNEADTELEATDELAPEIVPI